MTVPSPRLRTAWRVGSALAAAAGSAVVTSALVNRSRSRSQRKHAGQPPEAAAEPTPLAPTPQTPLATRPPSVPAAAGTPAELLVHDPSPAVPPAGPEPAGQVPPAASAPPVPPVRPARAKTTAPAGDRSDDLARVIEAADAIEAKPSGWARAASELRARTTAADSGWAPSAAALAGSDELAPPPVPPAGATPTPAVAEPATPSGPAADPAANGSPAWDYGLSGIDTRVPRLPGQEDRRKLRRHHRRSRDDAATPEATAASAATAAGARSNGATAPAPPTTSATSTTSTSPPVPPIGDRREPPPGGDRPGAGPGPGDTELAPDRRLLLFVGVAVTVAVLLGLGFVVFGGGGDDSPERADANPGTEGSVATQPSATTPVAQLTPAQAFVQAGQRLQTAGTFAYAGTSSATDVSPVRPGPWLEVNLTVEGEVQLLTPRLFERGTGADGSVVETVTDGETIWGRSAPSFDALTGQPLQTVYSLPEPTPAKVGALLLPQWFAAATGAADGGTDGLGRRTFRATLPAAVLGTIEDDRPPVDAVMVLALDEDGNPAHVEITTAAAGPPLKLVYDFERIGQEMPIQIPGDSDPGDQGSTGTPGSGSGQGGATGGSTPGSTTASTPTTSSVPGSQSPATP
jgi:hypothetical protein